MKRLSSSDSLGAMISICPSSEENKGSSGGNVYNRGFQSILDGIEEDDCLEESGHIAEKKRRLSVEQVKALEKNFEVENKLEPERKVKLAQELGLQPRQVAVWFQNRRARWKTKQLERDYGVLKSNYEALKINYEALVHDKEALLKELRELKARIEDNGKGEMVRPIKKEETEMMRSESENKMVDEQANAALEGSENTAEQNQRDQYRLVGDLKDGSSDSDSSAIFNDDNSPNTAISPEDISHMMIYQPATTSELQYDYVSSSSSCSVNYMPLSIGAQKAYHQLLRLEEPSFMNAEEACGFFSEDQPPTLPWYNSEPWN